MNSLTLIISGLILQYTALFYLKHCLSFTHTFSYNFKRMALLKEANRVVAVSFFVLSCGHMDKRCQGANLQPYI